MGQLRQHMCIASVLVYALSLPFQLNGYFNGYESCHVWPTFSVTVTVATAKHLGIIHTHVTSSPVMAHHSCR